MGVDGLMARAKYSLDSIRALRAKIARGERDIGTVAEADKILEAIEQELADQAVLDAAGVEESVDGKKKKGRK